jgi:hypothetical protein
MTVDRPNGDVPGTHPPPRPRSRTRRASVRQRRLLAIVAACLVVAAAAGVASRLRGDSTPDAGAPTSPPVEVCGNAEVLDGPSSPPTGAVRVEPGTGPAGGDAEP